MKHRLKELLKTAGAIALTLTLASAAFIGVNSAAFAAVTQPKQLLPVALSANTIEKTKNTFLKTDYQKPVLTVFEILSTFDKNTEALSPEEAAVIGARYIWDVYGESIDGKIVAMQYNGDTGRTRPYWIGTVGDSRTALEAAGADIIEVAIGSASAAFGGDAALLKDAIEDAGFDVVSMDALQ